jgi:uncharacterized damage-inducible protein DinB
MFRKVDDFVKYYTERAKEHATLFDALTDTSLAQAVVPGHRTLGHVAWHVVQSVVGMAHDAGLKVDGTVLSEAVPAHAARIGAAYRSVTQALLEAVPSQWQDDMLEGEIEMYGEQWTRGFALSALVAHEGHHIGQLTVLMRQAGLPVHGIYGPSKEEWAQYGMEQPAGLA